MSGWLQQRREDDGSAGKRRSDGGGGRWHLLLFLGAVLVLTPRHIVASSALSLRSSHSPHPEKATVPAPEGPDQKPFSTITVPSRPEHPEKGTVPAPEGPDQKPFATITVPSRPAPSEEQLDDTMEKVKAILRRSPKMLSNLNTVLKTRMDLENQIVSRIMNSHDNDEPGVDEEKVAETEKILREKLVHMPAVNSKFFRLFHGRHPTTLEDLENYVRNIDLSQAAPATREEEQGAAATNEEAKKD